MDLYAPEEFNNAKLVGVFTNGSSEWHEARAEGIGGSESGTILGLSQWESPFALWAKKTGKIPVQPLNNWAVRFGQKFEEPILELFQEEHPEYDIYSTGTYAHNERPYLHANPDALAYDPINDEWIIVEVKTSRSHWEEVPPAYVAQVRHYMAVMGLKKAIIVGLVNMTWVEHVILWDEFEEDVLLSAMEEFWSRIVNDIQPDWDGSTSTYEAVREMHPEIDDTEVEIDGLHLLAIAQEEFDRAEKELLKQKAQVIALMGKAKHAYIEHDGEKIRVASRQARAMGRPYLVVRKK